MMKALKISQTVESPNACSAIAGCLSHTAATAIAIYRIAQEALTNACQHSKSERILVSLLQRGEHLHVQVRDWGVGFDPKAVPKRHFGLEGIRQRARLLGGKCGIRSTAGKGTRVTVELPVVPREEER